MAARNPIAAFALAAAALLPEAASAAQDLSGFSGLLSGGFIYARTRAGSDVADSDQYVGQGSLLYTFDNPGFAAQIDVTDDNYFGTRHELAHIWSAGGSLFWRDSKGTIGLSGSYFAVDAAADPLFSGKKSLESYGAFGEYYVSNNFTLQARGGGTEGGGVGLQAWYGSGGLTWYDTPDLAAHVEASYTSYSSGKNWTGIEGVFEYLPFRSLPANIYIGYDYANISHGGDSAAIFLGLTWHFSAGRTLVDYERSGPIQWTGDDKPGANLKF
ncbi:MAG: hypothetical protein JOZ13_12120 [Alphaproteobacteria bacterium]|nr:hypothetical protein [Alphaproteobacteria bacterium]